MKFLLDVNALLAWAHPSSPHHARFHRWKKSVRADDLGTCAITELGFIRVSMQRFGFDLAMSARTLAALKTDIGHFLGGLPPPMLPAWSAHPAQTTDAYLCQVAAAHGVRLATFDTDIRDRTALVIP
jgi:predicted nucleic acid-binding protein